MDLRENLKELIVTNNNKIQTKKRVGGFPALFIFKVITKSKKNALFTFFIQSDGNI